MADSRSLRQFLRLLSSSGVSHLPTVTLPQPAPRKMINRPSSRPAPSTPAKSPPRKLTAEAGPAPPPLESTKSILEQTLHSAEDKSQVLCQLADVVADCRRCSELADSRRQTVFGVGNSDASIMFIGEAPGADEDRLGEPFVGAAGQLLNKIIEACGLRREEIYICNILRCRPPGNRNPQPQEALNCREFLDAQIRIVDPDYIVCWGTVAAQNLLQEKRSVGRLRGQFFSHGRAKVMCTYHPSYLLRHQPAKKQVWEDMKFFMKDQGIELN